MPVEIIIDHWNPSRVRYRTETFCYGPLSCPLYNLGPTRKVPGRNGMSYEEPDWLTRTLHPIAVPMSNVPTVAKNGYSVEQIGIRQGQTRASGWLDFVSKGLWRARWQHTVAASPALISRSNGRVRSSRNQLILRQLGGRPPGSNRPSSGVLDHGLPDGPNCISGLVLDRRSMWLIAPINPK
jgi:hypothetical protein